jgi:hypothetical protein
MTLTRIHAGQFVVRGEVRSMLLTRLRDDRQFKFPHDKFSGLDLAGRSPAVATEYLFGAALTQVMFLLGKIDPDQPPVQLAVATGNSALIVKNRSALLVLAKYDGESNVTLKIDNIVVLRIIDLKTARPDRSATGVVATLPVLPDLTAVRSSVKRVAPPTATSRPDHPVNEFSPTERKARLSRLRKKTEVTPPLDTGFLSFIYHELIKGHPGRHWEYKPFVASHPEFLLRFNRGGLPKAELEASLRDYFHWSR